MLNSLPSLPSHLGKSWGSSDWNYAFVPVIGPLIGGGLAGLLLRIILK